MNLTVCEMCGCILHSSGLGRSRMADCCDDSKELLCLMQVGYFVTN